MARSADEAEGVVREIRVEASPETVFEFFVDPERMARWKGKRAIADPRPGGLYRLVINDGAIARGEYVAIERPHRIVFTWGWEGNEVVPPGSSTVEVTFTPDGDATVVRLAHRGLPADEEAGHAEGWDQYLPRLAVATAGGDPGPDPLAAGPEG